MSQTVRLHVQYAGEAAHPFGVPEQEEAHDLLTLLELLSVALRQGAPLPQPPAEPQEGSSWATLESLMGKHWHSLAHHSDPEVRQAVAESWDTPMELLALLALDEDANVRQAVAGNEDAPVELLSLLASDKETQVQEAVARNERTPVEVLKALALDGDGYDVWVGLLSNSQTPREVVSILSEKGEEYVAWSARRIIESERAHEPFMQKPSLVQDRAGRVRSKKQTPEETLDTLAQDVYEVMVVVASDPQTPVEVVTALAEERVLFAAGKGSVEKPELLRDQHAGKRWLTNVNQRRLLWGKRRQYRAWFACLQQASVGTQWEIVASLDTPLRVRQAVFAALAFHWERKKIQSAFSESSFRWRIMAPFMPPIALQKLADSPCWEVRYLVAVREQTPTEARQRLCQDSNRYVRAMARAKTAQMGEKSMTETPEISC